MKNYNALTLLVMVSSFAFQYCFQVPIKAGVVSILLTIFAIFWGFYITSFGVFSTSHYLRTLYMMEDKHDSRKTLLDNFLGIFKWASCTLLISIIYLLITYIIIDNKAQCYWGYITYFIWGVLVINFFNIWDTMSTFIKLLRKMIISIEK